MRKQDLHNELLYHPDLKFYKSNISEISKDTFLDLKN